MLQATVDTHGAPVDGGVEQRRLSPPTRLTLTPREHALLHCHRQRLEQWGWVLREGRESAVCLEAQPVIQSVDLGQKAMLEYAEVLEATSGGSTLGPPAVLRVLASKACRRAVMFGDALDLSQCQNVIHALAQCELPFQCAHGRPTLVPLIDLGSLERAGRPI